MIAVLPGFGGGQTIEHLLVAKATSPLSSTDG
jgi:hypothetical protein